MRKFLKTKNGFTVTELIVAMGVFAVLLTVAVGAFIQALRNERRLLDLMSVNNNAGLVLEQIAREIRTGHSFQIAGNACGNGGGTELHFTNYLNRNFIYRLDQDEGVAIEKVVLLQEPEEENQSFKLTAGNVSIRNLCFIIKQFDNNKCNPWRITILMKVSSKTQLDVLPVNIQTTISSRVLPREIKNDPFNCR